MKVRVKVLTLIRLLFSEESSKYPLICKYVCPNNGRNGEGHPWFQLYVCKDRQVVGPVGPIKSLELGLWS